MQQLRSATSGLTDALSTTLLSGKAIATTLGLGLNLRSLRRQGFATMMVCDLLIDESLELDEEGGSIGVFAECGFNGRVFAYRCPTVGGSSNNICPDLISCWYLTSWNDTVGG